MSDSESFMREVRWLIFGTGSPSLGLFSCASAKSLIPSTVRIYVSWKEPGTYEFEVNWIGAMVDFTSYVLFGWSEDRME
jgi:hypothetical protein